MMYITQWRTSDSLCGSLKLALFCTLLVAVRAPAVTLPQKPALPLPGHHFSGGVTKNPHLKGVAAIPSRAKPAIRKKETGEVVHRAWHRRWDYHSWITLHRGLGMIRGFVHGPDGGGMGVTKVVLRKPGGGIFADWSRKHVTYTDMEGNFIMPGVRPGGYRVVAFHGKQKGHVHAAVHPGIASTVAIKV